MKFLIIAILVSIGIPYATSELATAQTSIGATVKNVLVVPDEGEEHPVSFHFSDNLIVVPLMHGEMFIFEKLNGIWSKPQKIQSNLGSLIQQASLFLDKDHFYLAGGNKLTVYAKVNSVWTGKPFLKEEVNGAFSNISGDGQTLFISHTSYKKSNKSDSYDITYLVYIYQKSPDGSYKIAQTLKSPANDQNDQFGFSLASNSKMAIIGSATETYLFENKGKHWAQTAKFGFGTVGDGGAADKIVISERCFVTAKNDFLPRGVKVSCLDQVNRLKPIKVDAPKSTNRSTFGTGFYLRGEYLVVGNGAHVTKHRELGEPDGQAYLLKRSKSGDFQVIGEFSRYLGATQKSDHRFGSSVFLTKDSALIADGVKIYEFLLSF